MPPRPVPFWASSIWSFQGRAVSLAVQDDGTGFNVDETVTEGRQSGFGLDGMRERARIVNGELTVKSERGQGTSVEVRIQTA